jgi:hypothetical protein
MSEITKIHGTGRVMMTRETADRVVAKFQEIGVSNAVAEEFGWNTGCYEVTIASKNSSTGNFHRHSIDREPKSEKEYTLIAKAAKGKASEKDLETLRLLSIERSVDAE